MRFDLMNKITPARGISPAAAVTDNTAIVSEIFDTRGFHAIMFLILLGALADTDATFTVLMEEGDQADLSDAVAVADSDLNGSEELAGFTFEHDDGLRKLGYIGSKRYVRVTITPAGNTGNAFVAGSWIAMADDNPPANPPE